VVRVVSDYLIGFRCGEGDILNVGLIVVGDVGRWDNFNVVFSATSIGRQATVSAITSTFAIIMPFLT
jgi:hypothetical protein